MHLMTFIEIAQPNWFERALIIIAVRADEAEHRDVNHGFVDVLDQRRAS